MTRTKKQSDPVVVRSQVLISHRTEMSVENDSDDLVVDSEERRVLSCQRKEYAPFYKKIAVKNVDELKSVLGVPDAVAAKRCCDFRPPAQSISARAAAKNFEDPKKSASTKKLLRAVTRNYIYGDSSRLVQWRPAIQVFLDIDRPFVMVPFFRNIAIKNGGVLDVSADTLTVHANKIELYGTGRILCVGPTTFDCNSFEGEL